MWLSGWGNFPKTETVFKEPYGEGALSDLLGSTASVIGRGLGRSYGDSALNSTLTVSSGRLNNLISFDDSSGLLVAGSGATLDEIMNVFAPRGWFLPVAPGTKFVTLGGAVAADAHGKNHHVAGSFSAHVQWLEIWTSKSGLTRCSPSENMDLFCATVGGHGLTGFITAVAVRLIPIRSLNIVQTLHKGSNLEEIMNIFEDDKDKHNYSVAWIDCLKSGSDMGRSILMTGDWSQEDDLPGSGWKPLKLTVPFNFPSFTLNKYSVKAFNYIYYKLKSRVKKTSLIHYEKFFFPLDSIYHWNRIYGRNGFVQYQIVLPLESSREGLPKILSKIVESGAGSFLAVLKLFGQATERPGNISFPRPGFTLALDFPKTDRVLKVLDELDAIALDYGARHYLSKDGRMTAETLARGYGRALEDFIKIKGIWDPQERFRSLQSDRLGITGRS
jgi:FAD/FMN-containing dehydrogenase